MKMKLLLALALCLLVGGVNATSITTTGAGKPTVASGCADANVIAWKAAVVGAGGTVSAGRETVICTLVGSLKANGSFTLLDRLWLYAAENPQSAQYDLVAASAHTVNGAPTFTIDRGYQQGATSDYINTNFNLSTATKFLQNDAQVSVYVQTSRTSSNNSMAFGAQDAASTGNQTSMHPLLSTDVFWGVNNSGNAFDNVLNANAMGQYTLNRTGSGAGASALYKNSSGTAVQTGSIASVARANLNMFVLSQNRNGSNNPGAATGDRIAMWAAGGSFASGAAAAQFQADINTYMTSVGANVY